MRLDKIKFSDERLNICQVSLKGNIPIILENYKKFKSFYKYLNILIICPKRDLRLFKKKLKYNEFCIISEDQIISFLKFQKIFNRLSKKYRLAMFPKIQKVPTIAKK